MNISISEIATILYNKWVLSLTGLETDDADESLWDFICLNAPHATGLVNVVISSTEENPELKQQVIDEAEDEDAVYHQRHYIVSLISAELEKRKCV
jgi:hypothetical protein